MLLICPQCQAKMAVDQRLPKGASVECPRCHVLIDPSLPPPPPKPTVIKAEVIEAPDVDEPDTAERPAKKKAKKKSKKSVPIFTWVMVGIGLGIVAAAGLLVAGLAGIGPLDFNRSHRVLAYCD